MCKVTGKERMEIPDKRHPDGNNVSYNPCYLGNIMYNGRLIPARDTAACFMIFNSDSQRFREIPPTLRVCNVIHITQFINCLGNLVALTQILRSQHASLTMKIMHFRYFVAYFSYFSIIGFCLIINRCFSQDKSFVHIDIILFYVDRL